MIVYDLVHGYQPFNPPKFVPEWVEYNINRVFLPNSIAMKNASVKRGVQLQGWTVDNFLKAPDSIKLLGEKVINNLKQAYISGNIEIGASGYSHALLPLFNKEVIQLQIIFDMDTLSKHVGIPTWFWFPEGAVDQRTLNILFDLYPDLIVAIPDTSLFKSNYSEFIKIKHPGKGEQKAVVFNSLLKDTMMNAYYYPTTPLYVPNSVNWSSAQNMVHNGSDFKRVLQQLGGDVHVLARDWENKGSADGLSEYEQGGTEIKGLLELDADIKLLSSIDWDKSKTINISEIKDASWECDAPRDDPYLYWKPNKTGEVWKNASNENREWVLKWEAMIEDYNNKFSTVVSNNGGVKNILKDERLTTSIKNSFSALMSCVPWHFLAKDTFDPNPSFSKEAWEKIVIPSIKILEKLA